MTVDRDYLSQLNSQQKAAVEYCDGPQLVIAGAGSGKTRVITYKIVHLLANGLHPRSILALTFTNKAAREMRERIRALVGDETASKLWMGTFHSMFLRILRNNADRIGFPASFTIYDSADSKSLIKKLIRELNLDDKVYRPGLVQNEISQAKNSLYSPENYSKDTDIRRANEYRKIPRMPELYSLYCERCRIAGAMDFDDLLYYTNILLRDYPDVLEYYRNFFGYILVDEYQDTNFAQHMLIRQLCGTSGNLCVVGDDAQSIYSFRGANIRNILDLRKAFPQLRTFKLEQNYRSTQNILGAANTLIEANKEQIPKQVFSNKEHGDLIEVINSFNEYEEAYAVASRIIQIRRRLNLNLSDIAVLYRTNAQSRLLEEALRSRNIAYLVYGGLAFYQRKEIKDAIAFLRLCVNPNDDEALARVINVPKRGIGDTTLKKLQAEAGKRACSIFSVISDIDNGEASFSAATRKKLVAFASMIETFGDCNNSGMNAFDLIKTVFETTGLLKEYMSDSTPENISKYENLLELINAVNEFVDHKESQPENSGLADFLREISLLTDQDKEAEADNSVTLMTIHAAKGLEFDAVFLVGAEERLLPSEKSTNSSAEIEEERRLMYVAITRARQFCMISYADQRTLNGQLNKTAPSRFLSDIAPRYLRIAPGVKLPRRTSLRSDNIGAPSAAATYSSRKSSAQDKIAPQAVTVRQRPTIGSGPASTATKDTECVRHEPEELSIGMKIHHSVYGEGIIINTDFGGSDNRITVRFPDNTSRVFILKYARFKIIK